jgi:hypothetical protein
MIARIDARNAASSGEMDRVSSGDQPEDTSKALGVHPPREYTTASGGRGAPLGLWDSMQRSHSRICVGICESRRAAARALIGLAGLPDKGVLKDLKADRRRQAAAEDRHAKRPRSSSPVRSREYRDR